MLHMIYDKAVLFRIYDNNGDPTGEEKPKLQIKQLATVSFTYNISRNVMRTRRINWFDVETRHATSLQYGLQIRASGVLYIIFHLL